MAGFLLMLLAGNLLMAPASAQTYSAVVQNRGSLLDKCPAEWTFAAPNPCEFTDPVPIPYREFVQYYITVPPSANYDLAITVASNRGDVDIQLLGPGGAVLASSAERIGDDVVQARRTVLSKSPGNYTLSLQAVAQSMSEYTVRVQATVSVTRLAAKELAVMAAISSQCCAPDDDLLPDSCTRLAAAIASNATEDDDLCLQPPNMCDAQGRLTKLVLSGGDKGNFVCSSFPVELGQLEALQVLDWTSNGQVGTLASVAAVLRPLASTLKRLYIGRNALSGPLECGLVTGTALEILRLDRNLLSGSVPPCMFQSAALLQLSLAGNLLSGSIPQLPPGCALNALDLSENGPPLGASTDNPGFTGALPDLMNAAHLSILALQSNSLTGTIPPLPSGVQVFKASHNYLTGPLPPSLDTASVLRVLDLSRNQLTGTLSGEITNNELLTVLRLAGNRMGGGLPYSSWGGFLLDVDLSENNFTGGSFSYLLYRPSLIHLNLAFNNLQFDIQEMGSKLDVNNSMLYFNISNNNVYGKLGEEMGRMQLFHQLLLQAVEDDEALEGSMPPQPLFDISSNLINSTFPLKLLPLLDSLFWQSPYEYIPLSFKLQPQKPTYGLDCPPPSTTLPPDIFYMDELQGLYDLTCRNPAGQQIKISTYQDTSTRPSRPPKPPAPPSVPPPSPPRPPRRRPPGPLNATDAPGQDPGGSSDKTKVDGPSTVSDRNATGDAEPGVGQPPPAGGDSAAAPSSKKGASIGVIVGIVAGVLVLILVAVLVGWYLYRRHQSRSSAYASKRTPLTHNATYEAPSEGTASNYADMQMFEFKTNERPARHRARLQ